MRLNRTLQWNLIVALFIPFILSAQVPNAGFENWTDGNPDDWFTSNLITIATPVTQSGDSRSGASAARGEVVPALNDTLPPLLVSGLGGAGFAIDQRYAALSGYYKLSPQGGDQLLGLVLMFNDQTLLGEGDITLTAAGSYTQFNIPINYFADGTPTRCIIEFIIDDTVNSEINLGTVFFLDDLSLGGATSIADVGSENIPQEFQLDQNFPNPFNPSTTITYGLPQAGSVRLDIYDLGGQLITTLVDGSQKAGRHAVTWQPLDLASGVYIYRLQTENQVLAKKMFLMK